MFGKSFVTTIALASALGFAYANTIKVDENYQLEYQIQDDEIYFTFQLQNQMTGWMTVVFNEFIFPADTIVVWWDSNTQKAVVWDAYNPAIATLPSFPAPIPDNSPMLMNSELSSDIYNNKENVQLISAKRVNGTITIKAKRKLITNDIFDFQLHKGSIFFIKTGYHPTEGFNADGAGYAQPYPYELATRFKTVKAYIDD